MTIEARFCLGDGDFNLAVNLSLPARGVTALFGPSGCGKTTLLRAMAGLEHDPGGFLRVADRVWQDRDHFVPPHRRSLGYVFQEASLFPHLTVAGNLEYGRKRAPKDRGGVSLDQVVELLGIGSLLARKPHTLSGGECQRVAIARAVASSPQLLLMDEPLAALDMERKQEILPYLKSLHQHLDIPVIYVTHSADEVAQLVDYLVLLGAEGISATGPVTELLTRLDLPLAWRSDAEALISATVAEHDPLYELTYLDFPGGRFTLPGKTVPVGARVRLRVAADDVSLTLSAAEDTSILNRFPATIEEISPARKGQVILRLAVGGVMLLSRITSKSAALLALKPGKPVYAQVKSVALLT